MRVKCAYFLAALICGAINPSVANDCFISDSKTRIGFFNGVGSASNVYNRRKSEDSANKIKELTGIQSTLYYNQTEGYALDLLEAYEQRLSEIPPDRRSSFDFLLPLFLKGGATAKEYSSEIAAAAKKFNADELRIRQKSVASDITRHDYTEHEKQLSSQLGSTSRMLLIGHSQGNLFMNHAYESLSDERKARVGIIHVAPASSVLYGPMVLSSSDTVIGGLQILRAMDMTIAPFNPSDWSGHAFIETYMAFPALRNKILGLIRKDEARAKPIGMYGRFSFDSMGDVVFGRGGVKKRAEGSGEINMRANKATYVRIANMPSCKAISQYDGASIGSRYVSTVARQVSIGAKDVGGFSLGRNEYCVNTEGVINKMNRLGNNIFFQTHWKSSSSAPSPGEGYTNFSCKSPVTRS